MADWGLQTVIRPKEYDEDDGFGSIDMKKEYDQALLFCFPHLFDHHHHHHHASTMETVVPVDQQLYKPFYPIYGGVAAESEFSHPPPAASDELQQVQKQSKISTLITTKLKKRKNQQKKVVVEVTEDGLCSDPWAWRKYGQKPIKGSIYPRSYYRCSTSKTCIARRQVEQSCTNSSIFILTYTADHNHPQPTRRNSLAGISRTRHKPTPKSPTISDSCKTVEKSKDSSFNSPTTPSVLSIDEEALQQLNIKQETVFYKKYDNQGINDDDCMVFSEDFFEGLEDLGGYKMDSLVCNSSNSQFPRVFS